MYFQRLQVCFPSREAGEVCTPSLPPLPPLAAGAPGEVGGGLLSPLQTLRGRPGREVSPFSFLPSKIRKCNIAKMLPIWTSKCIRRKQARSVLRSFTGRAAGPPEDLRVRAWSRQASGHPAPRPRASAPLGGGGADPETLWALGVGPKGPRRAETTSPSDKGLRGRGVPPPQSPKSVPSLLRPLPSFKPQTKIKCPPFHGHSLSQSFI